MKIWAAISSVKSNELNRTKGQAAFYTEALKSKYSAYEILPFKFIVESTTNPGNPLVFTCNQELLEIGKSGRNAYNLCDKAYVSDEYTVYMKFDKIKGFHQLIEDYKWYMENGFSVNREIAQSQGEFYLSWNGIIN